MNIDKTRHLPTSLYRIYDATGRLIYVGQSQHMGLRMRTHERNSWWFDFMADITTELHPTRAAAEAAEIVAIQEEAPAFNSKHADRPEHDWSHLTDEEVAHCRRWVSVSLYRRSRLPIHLYTHLWKLAEADRARVAA